MIGGVILAGGGATRLGGGDKCLLPLGDRPILAHVIARLRPGVAALALSANGDPARFAAFGLPVLPDGPPGAVGPLAGVLAGLDWAAARGLEAIVTAAAATPAFPDSLVTVLGAVGKERALAIAVSEGPDGRRAHPTFGLWPVALRAPLRAALAAGERRVGRFAESMGRVAAVFPDPSGDAFFNINTPGDLDLARRRFAARGA